MDRRRFLGAASVAAGTSLLACGSQNGGRTGNDASAGDEGSGPAVVTGPRVSWRLTSSYPRNLDILHGASEAVAERVASLTDDRFRIRVHPPGELVPGLEVMDAVQQGTVHCGLTAGYYYIGKNPALAFDTAVPFGLTARQRFAWLYEGGGLELLREVYSDFGIHSIPLGSTGGQWGGWFRQPVDSLDDLRGLRMRIPGLAGEIMSRLGVTVQVLAGADIYPALERGAIDATEWVGPYDDEKLGFHEIAQYYYNPGWWEPGVTTTLQVSRAAWDELPSQYRQALESACRETTLITLARYDAANPPALARLVDDHGVELREFSDEILAAAWETSEAYLAEQAEADPDFRRIHDHLRAFRETAFRYFGTNDEAYSRFAFGRV
ncbi:MAG: TRAP transporter substrate-binding protein [Gemmatimonadota bacterium]